MDEYVIPEKTLLDGFPNHYIDMAPEGDEEI